jgi:hypothetical protein
MGRGFDVAPHIEADGGRNEEEARLDEDATGLLEIEARPDELKWGFFDVDESLFELETWRFRAFPASIRRRSVSVGAEAKVPAAIGARPLSLPTRIRAENLVPHVRRGQRPARGVHIQTVRRPTRSRVTGCSGHLSGRRRRATVRYKTATACRRARPRTGRVCRVP